MREVDRLSRMVEEALARRCDELAQEVIDSCITNGLFHAQCSENGNHNCVVVWSSGAKEQIAAIIAKGKPSAC